MTNPLLIRVYSFSYRYGNPFRDPTGNGGGFVFDCRGLPNPGRNPDLSNLTGFDEPIVNFFREYQTELDTYIQHCFELVAGHARNYSQRGFADLQVAFGCTGGRHRSVFCANRLTEMLRQLGWNVRIIHWQLAQDFPHHRKHRGMILAAGFGTRLRPLTDTRPKALVEAGGRSMLDWCADALIKSGCSELVVNAHHHAEQIEQWSIRFRESHPEISLALSFEPEILGTGGGIRQAARWLHGPEPVLIHNCDIYTDFDLNSLYTHYNPSDLALLVCQQRSASSYLLVDDENRICGLKSPKLGSKLVTNPHGSVRELGFTGIHLIGPTGLEHLSKYHDLSIIDSYLKAIAEDQTVRAFEQTGNWFEMGNPERLEILDQYLRT